MKYKLIKTDFYKDGKLIPEGTVMDLTEKEAEEFFGYLEPVQTNEKKSAKDSSKTKNTKEK